MANSDITLGAQIRAIGNAVGMSEDQVIQMVIGAQRKGGRKLGRDIGTDEAQAAVLRRLQKVQGVNEEIPADLDELRTISNRELEFGEFGNQDELQNFGGMNEQGGIKNVEEQLKELEKAKGRKDPNVLARVFFEKVRKDHSVRRCISQMGCQFLNVLWKQLKIATLESSKKEEWLPQHRFNVFSVKGCNKV